MSALFISYFFKAKNSHGHGSCQIDSAPPIVSIKDVEAMSEAVREKFKFEQCAILNWRRFEPADKPANSEGGGK